MWNQTNTLLNRLHPAIEITSSGTTQRVQGNRYPTAVQEKLPIISTRKTHLTIDQRVWDADQSRVLYPEELTKVATLRHALVRNSSEGLGFQTEPSSIIKGPIDVRITSIDTTMIDRQNLNGCD